MASNRHFGAGYSHFGEDAKGHDLKVFGNTTNKYMFWDASADTLHIKGTLDADTKLVESFSFGDAEELKFGAGSDVSIQWDGTKLIISAAADDSLIEIGDSAATQKSFDLKWYGGAASGASYLLADASGNLISTVGIALTLGGKLTVGVNDTGHDVQFFGATAGCSMLWDESEDQLVITGPADVPGLKIDGAGSVSAVAFAAAGTAWTDGTAPAFVNGQKYLKINVAGTVYRIPLWADAS